MAFYKRWIVRLLIVNVILLTLSFVFGKDVLIINMAMTFVSVMLISFVIVAIQRYIK